MKVLNSVLGVMPQMVSQDNQTQQADVVSLLPVVAKSCFPDAAAPHRGPHLLPRLTAGSLAWSSCPLPMDTRAYGEQVHTGEAHRQQEYLCI